MKQLLLCLGIGLSLGCSGQVAFQDISFEEALKRSSVESRIIFLQFESDDCLQCNEVADKGLSDKALGKQINETFLPLKITVDHPDRWEIAERYNLGHGFGTFFVNSKGTLLHRFPRSTTHSQDYYAQIDMALNRAGESLKVDELEREFRNGNKSPGFLESLLLKKRSLGLSTEALLDEYVDLLPADSLQSVYTLTFLARMAPMLGSKADWAMRRNREAFHRAWMSLPGPQRVAINREVIARGIDAAIEQKNEARALSVARFCKGTYSSDSVAGVRAYTYQMMRYFEKTGDSTRYLALAIPYYNRYSMSISVDSIRRVDSMTRRKLLDQAPRRDSLMPDGTKRRFTSIPYAPVAQRYAAELNQGAWNVYTRTSDPEQLRTALEWSAKAVQLFESPEILNANARLWYRLGNKARAVEIMEKAIQLRQERGYPTRDYEAALERMSKNLSLDQ